MFFEGNEKKVEVIVAPTAGNLRERGVAFWETVVESAGAKILSTLKSTSCDAYLLSESSLFVWEDRFTMITCGQTTLVKAVEAFLGACSPEEVRSLIYERKNEYFPQLQKTDFFQDAKELKQRLGGSALQFGNSDEHHLRLFNYNKDFVPPANDFTLEILMYDLQGEAREVLACGNQSVEQIRARTKIDQIFDGFEVDDFAFNPCGYSLNALRGDDYYTIHVTPQDVGTYVSFETNVNLQQSIEPAVKRVLEVFKPGRFDVVVFSPVALEEQYLLEGFSVQNHVETHLGSGYYVSFSHYHSPRTKVSAPIEVEI